MINVLAEDRVFLNYGPVQMMLMARAHGLAMTEQLQEAAEYVIKILSDLAEVQKQAKDVLTLDEPDLSAYPLPLRLMVEAVLEAGDRTLTPMAAVAGTFADIVGDWLVEKGASKVMINNGGDIALRLIENEKTKLGLTPSIDSSGYSHILNLSAKDGIGGVATSGLAGRSFTKGIASAVTVFAKTARVADACATLIANHCFTEDPGILRLPAELLDPKTDISGHLVTVKVGDLSLQTKVKALENGLQKAIELKSQGCIHGAVLFLDDLVVMIPENVCQSAKFEGGIKMEIRKIVTVVEETHKDGEKTVTKPTRKAAAMAVIKNPFAGQYVEDLTELMEIGEQLGSMLAERAVKALGIAKEDVESYGKGAIVGEKGELEHAAAILHPRLGKPFREEVGGGKAIIPSAKKLGGMGTGLDVPVHFKDAAFVRTHYDAMEVRIADAPRADELVVALVVTDAGRPHPRIGGLQKSEVKGEDGLR